MNWEAIGALAEVAGAAVVVPTLFYLALQVRHTNAQAQGSAHAAFMVGWNDTIKGWITDANTITALRTGFSDFDALSKSQQAIFHLHLAALLNQWLLAAQLHDRGLLPEEIYRGATEVLISVHSTPGGLAFLERNAQATPRGTEILDMVKSKRGQLPDLSTLFPWWSSDAPEGES